MNMEIILEIDGKKEKVDDFSAWIKDGKLIVTIDNFNNKRGSVDRVVAIRIAGMTYAKQKPNKPCPVCELLMRPDHNFNFCMRCGQDLRT